MRQSELVKDKAYAAGDSYARSAGRLTRCVYRGKEQGQAGPLLAFEGESGKRRLTPDARYIVMPWEEWEPERDRILAALAEIDRLGKRAETVMRSLGLTYSGSLQVRYARNGTETPIFYTNLYLEELEGLAARLDDQAVSAGFIEWAVQEGISDEEMSAASSAWNASARRGAPPSAGNHFQANTEGEDDPA